MTAPLRLNKIEELAAYILQNMGVESRKLIAIAGPPGAGKSTASAALSNRLPKSAILQADGFHFDNALLDKLGRRQRKGAPDTFDSVALKNTLERLRRSEDAVVVPVFDRELDVSRGSAEMIASASRFIVVEGNYLASSEAPWSDLRSCFDMMVYIDVPLAELQRRLNQRWHKLGWPKEQAEAWVVGNDMPNIAFTEDTKTRPDVILEPPLAP